MKHRVLIIGGYGNFGGFIARRLNDDDKICVVVAGRSLEKAQGFARTFQNMEAVQIDVSEEPLTSLESIKPHTVIHTSGPFQNQGYAVAEACIRYGCHYIDLADGREFVSGIGCLNEEASKKKVLVVSGASSVPCLTSALIDSYQDQFEEIEIVDYAITTAQKTNRGLATTAAILGYTGRSFETIIDGKRKDVFGWQGLHSRNFGTLGNRMLGYCDIPDMSLFPERYPSLKTIRFYAGLEIPLVHLGLWGISWLVRLGLVRRLERAAPLLLAFSRWFDVLGTSNSGLRMDLSGRGKNGDRKTITFQLVAKSGDGPYIPCMPAIILAKRLARNSESKAGAFPCLGFITKDEYLTQLSSLDIKWTEEAVVTSPS